MHVPAASYVAAVEAMRTTSMGDGGVGIFVYAVHIGELGGLTQDPNEASRPIHATFHSFAPAKKKLYNTRNTRNKCSFLPNCYFDTIHLKCWSQNRRALQLFCRLEVLGRAKARLSSLTGWPASQSQRPQPPIIQSPLEESRTSEEA